MHKAILYSLYGGVPLISFQCGTSLYFEVNWGTSQGGREVAEGSKCHRLVM